MVVFIDHGFSERPTEEKTSKGLKKVGASIFEPTCAHCTMGSYASLSVCLDWTKITEQ